MNLWEKYEKQIADESEAAWNEHDGEDDYPYGPISYGNDV